MPAIVHKNLQIMDFIQEVWGVNPEIGVLEIAGRAAAMFILLLLMLRFFGMRFFGKTEPFDIVIAILLGSVAGRGIVGASPFFSSIVGCLSLVAIHEIMARLSFFNKAIGKQLKGEPILLFTKGEFQQDNMKRNNITKHDIYEELRYSLHMKTMEQVEDVYFERNGHISFILKGGFK